MVAGHPSARGRRPASVMAAGATGWCADDDAPARRLADAVRGLTAPLPDNCAGVARARGPGSARSPAR